MKIKASMVVALSLLVGILGIFLAVRFGIWDGTESEKTPAMFEGGAEWEGQYRADDIRGSYTFGEISQLYHIPIAELAEAFHIEKEEAEDFKIKDLETGTGSVKLFTAFYLGQPYDLGDSSTFMTAEGADIIRTNGKASREQLAYLDGHILGLEKEGYETIEVSGSDYFKDLASEYEIPLSDLSEAFGVAQVKAPFYQVKDMKNDFDVNVFKVNANSVKIFIAFYKGDHLDLSNAQSQITMEGANLLRERGAMLPEQEKYLESHITELKEE